MRIYNYHHITGEYISEGIADESPLEPGVYLIPANATNIQPPQLEDNQVALFRNGQWTIKPDFRGQKFYRTSDLTEIVINEIGALPDGLLPELPQKPSEYHIWNGSEYVLDTALIKQNLTNLIIERKKQAAYSGFHYTKNEKDYLIGTNEMDIGKASARALKLQIANQSETTWKCYCITDSRIVDLIFLKDEFLQLLVEIDDFIDAQFIKESLLRSELMAQIVFTPEWIDDFKSRINAWE